MKNKKIMMILLIIILVLMANTYAWFLFNSDVNLSISTNVKSWTIEFKADGQVLDKTVEFELNSIYPGMEDCQKIVDVINRGELAAQLEYQITVIELFGERKEIGDNFSAEEMQEYIKTLPFTIDLKVDNDIVQPGEEKKCKIIIAWPFEDENNANKDQQDTLLGIKAYEFNNKPENKDVSNLKLEIKLLAKQKKN